MSSMLNDDKKKKNLMPFKWLSIKNSIALNSIFLHPLHLQYKIDLKQFETVFCSIN